METFPELITDDDGMLQPRSAGPLSERAFGFVRTLAVCCSLMYLVHVNLMGNMRASFFLPNQHEESVHLEHGWPFVFLVRRLPGSPAYCEGADCYSWYPFDDAPVASASRIMAIADLAVFLVFLGTMCLPADFPLREFRFGMLAGLTTALVLRGLVLFAARGEIIPVIDVGSTGSRGTGCFIGLFWLFVASTIVHGLALWLHWYGGDSLPETE